MDVEPFIVNLVPPVKRLYPTTNLFDNPIRDQFKRALDRGYDSLV